MTIFFSDLRAFTSISERLAPEMVFRYLNAFFKVAAPIVRKHGGIVDKYIGDAILAIFDDPERAMGMTTDERIHPDHLFALFEQAGRRFRDEFGDALADAGASLPLSGSRMRVLQLVTPGGLRQTELAERAHMTKQSLGEILTALEGEGLVARRPDPSDGRAWIVERTMAGEEVDARIGSIAALAEERLASRLGRRDYATFRRVLVALALDG